MPSTPPQPTADGTKSGTYVPISSRRRLDWEVAGIAERQYGLVSLEQLRRLGMDESAVRKRVAAGRLHRVHDGVFAVGHKALANHGKLMAAVLACGSGAVLSHRSAAELWGIYKGEGDMVDVTAPHRRGRSPEGIQAHRDGSLRCFDRTIINGIPCTTVERTLLDLAAVLPIHQLRRAIGEAEVLRILDPAALRKLIRRSRGRRGVARLRMLMDELHPDAKRTRSELERLFLRMCVRADLPRPEVNVKLWVSGRQLEPDFLWRDAGLIVEADGRQFHDTGAAFQDDRRREQLLQLAGWRVSRCTWEQVEREPRVLAATIRSLLAQPSGRRA